MSFKYNIANTLCILSFATIGCKKFIQIDPPITHLVTTSVFKNNATATSAQLAIYAQMCNNSESFYMSVNNGLLSDELTNYSTDINQIQYYTNSLSAQSNPGPWTNAYNYIYQANAIIENLQNNTSISSAVQKQLVGESKFIRAFWHFYLTNIFGDIPLVLSTDYSTNATIARTPVKKIYDQLILDLKDAQNLLNDNYVDASDTSVTVERVRPNKWAATALLARVYLFNKDYVDAEAQASAVINKTDLYSLKPNLNDVFLANSQEAIWQLMIPLPSSNVATPDGKGFILIAAPGVNAGSSTTISPQLLSSFENNDARKINWIDSFTTASAPIVAYYFPNKYKDYQTDNVKEYVMMLRLAEQYLIRAEARVQQNKLTDAISDINIIRNRAGLLNTTNSTQNNLLTTILHERQVELFTEWGHRWFDLIRTENANSVMGNVTPQKGGTWNPDWQLYPLPQSEINSDPKLTQNNGY